MRELVNFSVQVVIEPSASRVERVCLEGYYLVLSNGTGNLWALPSVTGSSDTFPSGFERQLLYRRMMLDVNAPQWRHFLDEGDAAS